MRVRPDAPPSRPQGLPPPPPRPPAVPMARASAPRPPRKRAPSYEVSDHVWPIHASLQLGRNRRDRITTHLIQLSSIRCAREGPRGRGAVFRDLKTQGRSGSLTVNVSGPPDFMKSRVRPRPLTSRSRSHNERHSTHEICLRGFHPPPDPTLSGIHGPP